MQVLVRDNNVDQALKALKKKMQRAGIFREMKMPSRCIFFFSTLRAWSTLLSRTRTCTRRSSSIDRLMGPAVDGPVA